MRLALHINQYTDEEYDACFYSDVDYHEFKRDVKRTRKMVEMKQRVDEVHYSLRGIESIISEDVMKAKVMNRKTATLAVMKEQALIQNDSSNSDDNAEQRIGTAYTNVNRGSTTSAYLMGLADETFIQEERQLEFKLVQSHVGASSRSISSTVLSIVSSEKSLWIRRGVINHAA